MIELLTQTGISAVIDAPSRIDPQAKALGNLSDVPYAALKSRVQYRFEKNLGPLFTTDADLWPVYLSAFPVQDRQSHNCYACRHFLKIYGGLANIDEHGNLTSALWNPEDEDQEYRGVFAALARAVSKSKVTGVFLSSDSLWGVPSTKQWMHFHLRPPASIRYKVGRLDAHQAMAEKKEDHGTVMRALAEFTVEQLDQALVLLKSDALYRAEKVIGPIQWLRDLRAAEGNRNNLVWRAVATRAGRVLPPAEGSLLDDIASGMDFATVSERWKKKMHPLQYQRPQAPPSAGQIDAAEKLVEKLGIAPALKRRFARLEECEKIWTPRPVQEKPSGSVFGHLREPAWRSNWEGELAAECDRLQAEVEQLRGERAVPAGPFGMSPQAAADHLHDAHVELLALRAERNRLREALMKIVGCVECVDNAYDSCKCGFP